MTTDQIAIRLLGLELISERLGKHISDVFGGDGGGTATRPIKDFIGSYQFLNLACDIIGIPEDNWRIEGQHEDGSGGLGIGYCRDWIVDRFWENVKSEADIPKFFEWLKREAINPEAKDRESTYPTLN